jgi:branched-chain amino acid transport system substrate-binding protein
VTSLAATRADVFFLGATLLGCPASLGNVASSGWDPLVYMSGTCTSKTLMDRAVSLGGGDGVLSVIPLLDPVDPANASNAEVQLYREKIGQYAPAESDADNAIVAYGWSTAALLADLLSKSPAADRVSVRETARAYEASGVALMPDGVTFRTTADDWFLGETFQLVRYTADGGYFEPVGDLVDEDGNTAEYTPDDLVNG